MAYMSQEQKKAFAPAIKALCAKYKVKGTLSVRNYSTIVFNIRSGAIDFLQQYNDYRSKKKEEGDVFYQSCTPATYTDVQGDESRIAKVYEGDACAFLKEAHAILHGGNHNNSDIMTDYFDVGWYVDISIGQWDKPYIYTGA